MARLTNGLKLRGVAVENWYYKTEGWRRLYGVYRRCDIIHINMSNPIVMLVMALAGRLLRKQKTLITIHGDSGHVRGLRRLLLRLALRVADLTFVLNDGSRDWVAGFLRPEKYAKVTAFLPPSAAELTPAEADKMLAADLVRRRQDYAGVFMTYAFNYELNADNHDLYGIDELVELFSRLPAWFLLVVDPTAENFKRHGDRLAAPNIDFVTTRVNTLFLMRSFDGYIRNTMTDGDSLAVREALHLGLPCFASDAISRPRGAVVYPQHDFAALEGCLQEVLARPREEPAPDPDPSVLSYYERLLTLRDGAHFDAAVCAS